MGPFQLEFMFSCKEQDFYRQKYRKPRKINLTKEEYKDIRSLKQNNEIIIKPTDKGSAKVIMEKAAYINEGQKQCNNTQFYEPTDTDLTGKVIPRVNLHVHNMLHKGEISQSTCSYLTTYIDRMQQFYMLPKINKDKKKNQAERPIVSGSGGPTNFTICGLFHRTLSAPFPTIHKDLTHLVNIVNHFSVQQGILLCTLDVTNIYTNIPHNKGIQAIKEMLAVHRPPYDLPYSNYIVELLEVVLTNNYFEFSGAHYHQVSGTAMGTKLAP